MADTRLLDHVYEAHRYLSTLENTPRDYGTGELLFASDVHTVAAIAARPGANLTELSTDLGISKAAASKFVAKLMRRGYVVKEKNQDDRREVRFRLTEKGALAASGHARFVKNAFGRLYAVERELGAAAVANVEAYFQRLLAAAKD
jgi:DNA-binding MarR family transcriptional regulator